MIVKQIWTGNAYRNFNYLIACGETGEALAIDPLDSEKCLQAAKIAFIVPHEHDSHHERIRSRGRARIRAR